MHFTLTANNYLLKLEKATTIEIRQLEKITTAKSYNYVTKKEWVLKYFHQFTYIPSGLWYRVIQLKKMNYDVTIDGLESIVSTDITKEYVEAWVDSHDFTMFDENNQRVELVPRWYQVEALYLALKYHISRCQIATRGGKSLILYMYIRFLIEHGYIKDGKKVLIITPRRMLVKQMIRDFHEYYDDDLVKCDHVFSGGIRLADSNVVVGTYHTLSEYDKEYYKNIAAVICDEAHTASSASIKEGIMHKLETSVCQRRYAVSGTQPPLDTPAGLTVEAYFGPVLFNISARQLMDEKSIADIDIMVFDLHYGKDVCYEYYHSKEVQNMNTRLSFEKNFIYSLEARNDFIAKVCGRFEGNQMILVESVAYCNMLAEYIAARNPHKQVMLIYGAIGDKMREQNRERMEEGDDKILIATYGTMSTGVTIKNIMAIHFPDCGKSDIRIRQSTGRGLCITAAKSTLRVFDYCDIIKRDYSWEFPEGVTVPHKNIFHRHALSRMSIYKEQKFPYTRRQLYL